MALAAHNVALRPRLSASMRWACPKHLRLQSVKSPTTKISTDDEHRWPAPKVMLADGGYYANFIREAMEKHVGIAMIPTE